MSVIVVIPARYNSSRFPGKALFMIKGKALIHHVYDNVKRSKSIDDCIIATDDAKIYDYCQSHHIKVKMTSVDHMNGTERVAEVAQEYDDNDIIINIQGDEPMVTVDHINLLINMMILIGASPIASLGREISYEEANDPNIVKLVRDRNNTALYFSRSRIPFLRDEIEEKKTNYIQHVGMYAFRAGVLEELVLLKPSELEKSESLEQLRWLQNGYRISIGITDQKLIGIDTLKDVEKLLLYWNEVG